MDFLGAQSSRPPLRSRVNVWGLSRRSRRHELETCSSDSVIGGNNADFKQKGLSELDACLRCRMATYSSITAHLEHSKGAEWQPTAVLEHT